MRKDILIFTLIFFLALSFGTGFYKAVLGATNISATPAEHYAWGDIVGWMDYFNTNTVTVTSGKVEGYASSTIGDISLDCATTRIGSICGQSSYWVVNDGSGNLSGWGWNDLYGWISFSCGSNGVPDGCNNSNYQVYIDASGDFHGYAWNDVLGWLSFNCSEPGICGISNFKVKTSWVASTTSGTLDSSTFDTGVAGGAQINSILWRGTMPSPTNDSWVGFQLAVATSSNGPWAYAGYDGTSATWYIPTGPAQPIKVDYIFHNNYRYFRYRVKLTSNLAQTASPRVEEIIINWSR